MTGTTRTAALSLLLLLAACRSANDTAPAKVKGAVSVALDFEYLGKNGEKKDTVDFTAAVIDALKQRGVTVEDGAKAKISGRASLADEPNPDSKIGGPMAFFFVRGAYDYAVTDAASGKELGRAQGALDLRELKEKALISAKASYDQTAKTIVADAAPRAADEIIQLLWRGKFISAD